MSSNDTYRPEIGIKWIKSQTGGTYLCPADALDRVSNHSDEELSRVCVNESENPQND